MDDTPANADGRRDQCSQLGERKCSGETRHQRVGKGGGSTEEATDCSNSPWGRVWKARQLKSWSKESARVISLAGALDRITLVESWSRVSGWLREVCFGLAGWFEVPMDGHDKSAGAWERDNNHDNATGRFDHQ